MSFTTLIKPNYTQICQITEILDVRWEILPHPPYSIIHIHPISHLLTYAPTYVPSLFVHYKTNLSQKNFNKFIQVRRVKIVFLRKESFYPFGRHCNSVLQPVLKKDFLFFLGNQPAKNYKKSGKNK